MVEILDRYRAALQPVVRPEYDEISWLCALHRIDLREYTISNGSAEEYAATKSSVSSTDDQRCLLFDPKEHEPAIKEYVDQHTAEFQPMNARLCLLMWGVKVFGNEENTMYDPARWRERLEEARNSCDGDVGSNELDPGRGVVGIVASVCVRDHWEEMSVNERDWSVDSVCWAVKQHADLWDQYARYKRNIMFPDRQCASVIPFLFGKALDDARLSRVRDVLVVALTHAIDEVRLDAAVGVGKYLWKIDPVLTLRCVNALATAARLVQESVNDRSSRPWEQPRPHEETEAEAANLVRRQFYEDGAIVDGAYQALDINQWFGAKANRYILAILGQLPAEPVAIAGFQRLATTLVEWWDADQDRRDPDHDRHPKLPDRDYQTESALSGLLENFLLDSSIADATSIIKPIIEAIDRHPDEIRWLLLDLITIEDRQPRTPQFWTVWDLFAAKAIRATWLANIDDEHASGSTLISALFLGTWWKEDVRHWRSLEGHARHVHAFFEELPASSTILDAYTRFLYHAGGQSLPEAFIRIAKRIPQGDPEQMIRKGNTVFLLEVMLQKYVYGRPRELKSRGDLREAVLFLLDLLVENGSSAAFRMRDDFVTPISIP